MRTLKDKARGRSQYLQTIGAIYKPETCHDCGRKVLLEKHHEDYSDPANVTWICRLCHVKRHRRHLMSGVAAVAIILICMTAVCGCAYLDKVMQDAEDNGTTMVDELQPQLNAAASFLPSPWREILIGTVGLGLTVYQTVGKSRLKKKVQQTGGVS